RDGEGLALAVGDPPDVAAFVDGESVRRVHPVEWFVRSAVRVDGHATVGLHHDQAGGLGKVGREPADVVDVAAGDHETHGFGPYRPSWIAANPGHDADVGCSGAPRSASSRCSVVTKVPPMR